MKFGKILLLEKYKSGDVIEKLGKNNEISRDH